MRDDSKNSEAATSGFHELGIDFFAELLGVAIGIDVFDCTSASIVGL